MKSKTTTLKNYEQHRQNQRERILESAENLFIQKGISEVSMSAIAKTARIARITLYNYFQNKEEIAWAIFQKTVEYFKEDLSSLPSSPAVNTFQRLENIMQEMVNHWEVYAEHFRYIVEFNSLYVRENNPGNIRQVVEQSWAGVYDLTTQLIREGIEDGSLRSDLNPDLVAAAFSNLINAVSSWFALLGGQLQQEYRQPVKNIYQEIFRSFLRGIQAQS